MAESQLLVLEDGQIPVPVQVPESRPEFYYSEEQRAAVEELLRSGDGAFKTRLKEVHMTDFLSAREIKVLNNTFRTYDQDPDPDPKDHSSDPGSGSGSGSGSGLKSTYWPQMSDVEVPGLDLGWPSGGFFRGVTRINVHTHPPKDQGPHIKEVVRRMIQEASKVIAIVMDLLTDVHILQDLMEAAGRRSVPVYILLDSAGVPHFLDLCSRLQIGSQHLRNIRTRTLQGTGLALSIGRLPGSLCHKYMLVDGDKVAFGSYSFCWCTSRMDRNMITVMTGQVVDVFDRDFRELYAVSHKLDLYKEFHVSPPPAASANANATATLRPKAGPKRPPLPAMTSRFQVSLGDNANIQVPAHKYYNPKYLLAFGDVPRPPGSLQEPGPTRGSIMAEVPEDLDPDRPRVASSEKMERKSPLPSEDPREVFKKSIKDLEDKKGRLTWRQKLFRRKADANAAGNANAGANAGANVGANASPKDSRRTDVPEENVEVVVKSPRRTKKLQLKLGRRTESETTVTETQSVKSRRRGKPECNVS